MPPPPQCGLSDSKDTTLASAYQRSNDMIFRDTLDITRGDLEWAASQGLLTQEQVEPLWNQWRARQQADDRAPRFSASNVSYYIGTCIIALGMIWLLYLAWDKEWGGMVVFGIAAAYDVVLYTSGNYLWHKRGQKRLAGLLLFIAILIVPIAVYGLQYQMGWWYRPPDVNPYNYNPIEYMSTRKEMLNLLPMELSAVVASFVTLIFYPFPFLLTVPLCIGWFMAVTWAQYSLGFDDDTALACLVYGILCFVCAFRLDQVYSVADGPDWAFWPYFVGAISFWSGLAFNSIVYEKELYQFLFCLINVGIILVAVALKRRIFMVLGAIGTFAYILHLNDRFGDFVLVRQKLFTVSCEVFLRYLIPS